MRLRAWDGRPSTRCTHLLVDGRERVKRGQVAEASHVGLPHLKRHPECDGLGTLKQRAVAHALPAFARRRGGCHADVSVV